jgi:hypothetical protein
LFFIRYNLSAAAQAAAPDRKAVTPTSHTAFLLRKAVMRDSFEDCGLDLTSSIIVIPENKIK